MLQCLLHCWFFFGACGQPNGFLVVSLGTLHSWIFLSMTRCPNTTAEKSTEPREEWPQTRQPLPEVVCWHCGCQVAIADIHPLLDQHGGGGEVGGGRIITSRLCSSYPREVGFARWCHVRSAASATEDHSPVSTNEPVNNISMHLYHWKSTKVSAHQ